MDYLLSKNFFERNYEIIDKDIESKVYYITSMNGFLTLDMRKASFIANKSADYKYYKELASLNKAIILIFNIYKDKDCISNSQKNIKDEIERLKKSVKSRINVFNYKLKKIKRRHFEMERERIFKRSSTEYSTEISIIKEEEIFFMYNFIEWVDFFDIQNYERFIIKTLFHLEFECEENYKEINI